MRRRVVHRRSGVPTLSRTHSAGAEASVSTFARPSSTHHVVEALDRRVDSACQCGRRTDRSIVLDHVVVDRGHRRVHLPAKCLRRPGSTTRGNAKLQARCRSGGDRVQPGSISGTSNMPSSRSEPQISLTLADATSTARVSTRRLIHPRFRAGIAVAWSAVPPVHRPQLAAEQVRLAQILQSRADGEQHQVGAVGGVPGRAPGAPAG